MLFCYISPNLSNKHILMSKTLLLDKKKLRTTILLFENATVNCELTKKVREQNKTNPAKNVCSTMD